jgi:glycerophosphoryl diester phosphodiesterase
MPENKCYWLSSVGAEVKSKIRDAAQAGLGLDLSYRIIDKELMKQATDLGLEVLCWTVDDPQQAKRLVALGVKGITTNRPAWLKEQLNKE